MTPRLYQPGCPMSSEQWQKSEGNRIKTLTIRKDKSSQGPLQDHIRPFGSSSYAANMTLAAIDYEVQRQVESARCFSMEQEIMQPQQSVSLSFSVFIIPKSTPKIIAPVKFATTTLYNGFTFTLHKANDDGSKRMRGSCHRAEKECPAIIKIMPDGAVISCGSHAPGCMRRNGIDLCWGLYNCLDGYSRYPRTFEYARKIAPSGRYLELV